MAVGPEEEASSGGLLISTISKDIKIEDRPSSTVSCVKVEDGDNGLYIDHEKGSSDDLSFPVDVSTTVRTAPDRYRVSPWFVATIAITTLPLFSDGFNMAVANNSVNGVREYYAELGKPVSAASWSTFVSLFMGGAMSSSLVAGPVMKLLGPRRTMTYNNILYVIGCIVTLTLHKSFAAVCAARFIFGVALGINMPTMQILVQESSPAEIRGIVQMVVFACMSSGNTMGFLLGMSNIMGTPELWFYLYSLSLFPISIHLLFSWFVPESPRWLLLAGRPDQSDAALRKLRHISVDSTPEMEALKASLTYMEVPMKTVIKMLFFSKRFVRPMVIVVMLPILIQFILGSFIFYYSSVLFEELGFSNGQLVTVFVGVVVIVSMFFTTMVIEKLGRRGTLMYGWMLTGMLSVLFTVAAVNSGTTAWNIIGIIVFLTLIFVGTAPTSVVYMLAPELFPSSVRAVAVGTSHFVARAGSFMAAKTFLGIVEGLGEYTFLLFACCSVLGVLFAFFMVPETSGVPLEEVEKLYKNQGTFRRKKKPTEPRASVGC